MHKLCKLPICKWDTQVVYGTKWKHWLWAFLWCIIVYLEAWFVVLQTENEIFNKYLKNWGHDRNRSIYQTKVLICHGYHTFWKLFWIATQTPIYNQGKADFLEVNGKVRWWVFQKIEFFLQIFSKWAIWKWDTHFFYPTYWKYIQRPLFWCIYHISIHSNFHCPHLKLKY